MTQRRQKLITGFSLVLDSLSTVCGMCWRNLWKLAAKDGNSHLEDHNLSSLS